MARDFTLAELAEAPSNAAKLPKATMTTITAVTHTSTRNEPRSSPRSRAVRARAHEEAEDGTNLARGAIVRASARARRGLIWQRPAKRVNEAPGTRRGGPGGPPP